MLWNKIILTKLDEKILAICSEKTKTLQKAPQLFFRDESKAKLLLFCR